MTVGVQGENVPHFLQNFVWLAFSGQTVTGEADRCSYGILTYLITSGNLITLGGHNLRVLPDNHAIGRGSRTLQRTRRDPYNARNPWNLRFCRSLRRVLVAQVSITVLTFLTPFTTTISSGERHLPWGDCDCRILTPKLAAFYSM
ncbi:hypothetical protein ARMSODRAFT_1009497 [Armillaria solidipes]|uniref:Uncharacterized protein n=1 Tax=Armillaria solidipes TaxID=1076256 RepID=A0A2H3BA81_9AGAR|nr:hypothetical protein ARMSODRAFT_1009497 [Armillaria solidipes]